MRMRRGTRERGSDDQNGACFVAFQRVSDKNKLDELIL